MKPVRAQDEVEKIKQKILSSALDIIVLDGFNALTMRRLAKDIGMTAPNIYNYFSNKDEIYITLMTHGFEKLTLVLDTEINGTKDAYARGKRFMTCYLKFGLENSSFYEIMFTSSTPKYKDYVGTAHEALFSREHKISMSLAGLALQVVQEVAVEKGVVVDVEKSKFIMTTLWSVLHGMVSLYNSKNIMYVVDDPESLYYEIIDKLMGVVDGLYA
jgi:AcrR family transcriptional regulator